MSDPSNSALFSCPFCGGVAKAFAVDMSVVCIGCQAEIVAMTVAEAVAAWNRRARNPAFDILIQTYDECLTPIANAFGFSGPEIDDSFLEYMLECAAELKTTDAHFQALLAEHEQIEQAIYEGHDYRFEWDPTALPTMVRQQRMARLHPQIDVNAAADKINRAIFSVTGCGIEQLAAINVLGELQRIIGGK